MSEGEEGEKVGEGRKAVEERRGQEGGGEWRRVEERGREREERAGGGGEWRRVEEGMGGGGNRGRQV